MTRPPHASAFSTGRLSTPCPAAEPTLSAQWSMHQGINKICQPSKHLNGGKRRETGRMFADHTRVRIGEERQVENSSSNNKQHTPKSQVSQGSLKGILKISSLVKLRMFLIKCVGCRKRSTRGNLSAPGLC